MDFVQDNWAPILLILLGAIAFAILGVITGDNITYEFVRVIPDNHIETQWYIAHGWKMLTSPDGKSVFLYYSKTLDDEEYVPREYEPGK